MNITNTISDQKNIIQVKICGATDPIELKMHDLSSKILAETDPAKQQALKDQQLELIKAEHMQMMNMHHPKMMK